MFTCILPFHSKKLSLNVVTYCFPGSSDDKEPACNVGELGSVPGLARSPGDGDGNRLQYSCLDNPLDKGAWQATVHEGGILD